MTLLLSQQHRTFLITAIAGASLILFVLGSWQMAFIGPDEPRYAHVARQMYASGDFITPQLGENPWFEKPVLLYWLICICYAFFGVTEFAARLPSALAAVGSVLAIYYTMRRTVGETEAALAAVVLATCAFVVGFSHAATFDMLLTFFVTCAICCFLLFEHGSHQRYLLAMYFFAGLGVLAKGFVAPVLVALAVGSYLILTGQWRRLFELKLLTGIVIIAAVTAIWFIPATLKHGQHFWDEFFYQHHVVRYTSSRFHRSGGPLYYLPVLLAGTFPWTFAAFLPKRTDASIKLRRFALCWLLSILFFFSFSGSKLPGYALPIAPAFAILAAMSLSSGRWSLKRLLVLAVPFHVVVIVALVVGASYFQVPQWATIAVIIVLITISAASVFLLSSGKSIHALVCYSLFPTAAVVIFTWFVYPAMNLSETKDLCQRLQQHWATRSGSKLALYNVYDFGAVFYLNGAVDLDKRGYFNTLQDYRQLHRYVQSKKEAYVLMGNDELTWLRSAHFLRVKHLISGKEKSIVHLTVP